MYVRTSISCIIHKIVYYILPFIIHWCEWVHNFYVSLRNVRNKVCLFHFIYFLQTIREGADINRTANFWPIVPFHGKNVMESSIRYHYYVGEAPSSM